MAKVFPVVSTAVPLLVEVVRAVNESLSSGSGEHDLVVGTLEDGDILLHSEKKSVGYGWWRVSHVYQYSGDTTITAVVAKDNRNDDTGGDPEIVSGGPGHKHVKVKVTSRFLRGFDHTVYVCGRKNDIDQDSNMAKVFPVVSTAVQFVGGAVGGAAGGAVRAVNESLSSGSGEHDLVVSKPEVGDILLYSEEKSVDNEAGRVSHVYQYSGDITITAVVAKDNKRDDTGGDPEIISGGPGEKHVSVKVTSKTGKGFDHTVHVYGRKNSFDQDSNMAQVIPGAGPALQLVNLAGEAWTTIEGNGQHNLVVGKPQAGDILLHAEQKCQGRGFDHVSHVYQHSGDNTITAVVAKDNWNDDKGGDPEIISGGVGHKHVKVKVTSRSGGGFNHTVYVFGKKQKLTKCNLF